MMIPVRISKITLYPPSKGYAVLLKETEGKRQLPVIIGAFEAQAIAFALEKVSMPRPMTHDLISNIFTDLNMSLNHVLINDLIEGTFYAKLHVSLSDGTEIEIDSRPSDAIAVALRQKAPIYISDAVMNDAGILGEKDSRFAFGSQDDETDEEIKKLIKLQSDLQQAVEVEDYEKAARIRDEIQRIEDKTKS